MRNASRNLFIHINRSLNIQDDKGNLSSGGKNSFPLKRMEILNGMRSNGAVNLAMKIILCVCQIGVENFLARFINLFISQIKPVLFDEKLFYARILHESLHF